MWELLYPIPADIQLLCYSLDEYIMNREGDWWKKTRALLDV